MIPTHSDFIDTDTEHKLPTKADIIRDVNVIIDSFYDNSRAKAAALHPRFELLLEVMHNLTAAGGKRMRPYLAVSVYTAYGGAQYKDMCHVGAALELLHTAMLIHDDIIDRDLTRYGIDNVAGQYLKIYGSVTNKDPDHYSTAAALLAGDINISAAYQLVLESGFSAEQKIKAHTYVAEAIFRVAGGELIDTDAVLYPSEQTDPLTVAEIKTAHYSFVTPMLCGAALAGAEEAELNKLTQLGMSLGVAFQLSDDILGMFGDESITGKSTIGDIREGRRTWMAEYAKQHAPSNQKLLLHEYYGADDITIEQADAVRRVFVDCGAKQACSDKIAELLQEAIDSIETLNINPSSKNLFLELVHTMSDRQK
jgi:geranylgeranyl diphosphate synthase type II